MCDAKATSREHVPPECFFPETKCFGRDLRKNLISVPSCDKHNTVKSSDDEWFRAVITMLAGRNQAGWHQFTRKTLSAVRRRPETYRTFFNDKGPVRNPLGRALQIDRRRLDLCCDRMARALIFHAHAEKWLDGISIFTPNLFVNVTDGLPVRHELTDEIVAITRGFLGAAPVQGANPEVFRYRLRYEASERGFAFAAQFYQTFEFFALPASALERGVYL
jgi:hypothetical protein